MLIVFEGGDGAGKTTQAKLLAEYLRRAGRTVTTTHEPGGTPAGERIRELLLDTDLKVSLPPRAETLLFLADQAAHVDQVIVPGMRRGDVISDRFCDSTIVYQGLGRGLSTEQLTGLCRWATEGIAPDLVFVLDVDPKIGLARARHTTNSAGPDRIERDELAFHHRIRVGFLRLAEGRPGYHVIATSARDADDVAAAVRGVVDTVLLNHVRAGAVPC